MLCQPGSPPACLARSGVPEREHGQTDFEGPAGGREKAPNATRLAPGLPGADGLRNASNTVEPQKRKFMECWVSGSGTSLMRPPPPRGIQAWVRADAINVAGQGSVPWSF